jgi:hypothetical protein
MGGYLTDVGEVRFIRCKFLYCLNFEAIQSQYFLWWQIFTKLKNVGN